MTTTTDVPAYDISKNCESGHFLKVTTAERVPHSYVALNLEGRVIHCKYDDLISAICYAVGRDSLV